MKNEKLIELLEQMVKDYVEVSKLVATKMILPEEFDFQGLATGTVVLVDTIQRLKDSDKKIW